MKVQKCEMCGKTVIMIQEHHIVPWWFSHDDSESNIMRLCVSCHRKADASFNNLILYGKMHVGKDYRKRINYRYNKKYTKRKTLYYAVLLKYTYYYDILKYNAKTEHISIIQRWQHTSNRYISTNINSRKRLVKAALSKGQTVLSGGH